MMLWFVVIAAILIFAVVVKFLLKLKPNEEQVLTTLISCQLLAKRSPFLSRFQVDSMRRQHQITDDELTIIYTAALFRVYVCRIDKMWRDKALSEKVLRMILKYFPSEWEILSEMFSFEISGNHRYKTVDEAMRYTAAYIGTCLLPGDEGILKTLYKRLRESRI